MDAPQTDPNLMTRIFKPVLEPFFSPINDFLGRYYMPWATICALGLFIGAMIWVFTLRKEYVNVDAPEGFFLRPAVLTIIPCCPMCWSIFTSKWS